MFGRQAMTLLEWAARLCKSDGSGAALTAFSAAIEKIDSRYFTPLPDVCMKGGAEFALPASPTRGPGDRQLLWAMFDLIRNGQAHQYQQINVTLRDGKEFAIGLTGAREGLFLHTSMTGGREFYRRVVFRNPAELAQKLRQWEHEYNHRRLHLALRGKTPGERLCELRIASEPVQQLA